MSAFDNVAARLKEHLPFKKDSDPPQPITAWADQAKALNRMAADLNDVRARVAKLEGTTPTPEPEPEPEPEPIPPQKYAPRAYNSTPSADARFCMSTQYGVARDGNGYVDSMGVRYDEAGRDLGGRSKNIVPELKGANSMDGREPCDEYVGPTGRTIGGSAGYPAASFER
jgi:hypothetical protein